MVLDEETELSYLLSSALFEVLPEETFSSVLRKYRYLHPKGFFCRFQFHLFFHSLRKKALITNDI